MVTNSPENPVLCPECGSIMLERTARRGPKKGKNFYGCSRFPACRGIIDIATPIKKPAAKASKTPVGAVKVSPTELTPPKTTQPPVTEQKNFSRQPEIFTQPDMVEVSSGEPSTPAQLGPGTRKPISDLRKALVENAIKKWIEQLMDTSGRNGLLFYRHLKVGTLDLSETPETALASLFMNKKVKLSDFFPESLHFPDAAKRTRVVIEKGRSNFEEKGLQTLYVAFGMATWDIENRKESPKSKPNAPVLMQPLLVTPKGIGTGEYEFSLLDEPEINPTLLHYLNSEIRAGTGNSVIGPNSPDSLGKRRDVLQAFEKACSNIPGFKVNENVVVGNFSYANLPIVRDLENHVYELASDVLISAIAGDDAAKTELRDSQVSLDLDNLEPIPDPEDEFLVLDADSSQSWVIQAGVKGAHLVVQGPPGTGKSQTIANLIASASARGKTVLFVSQKRAAIEAVTKRLDNVGLSDLVLDLHSRSANKRHISETLNRALTRAGEVLEPEFEDIKDSLNKSTSSLQTYKTALHKIDSTWGLSIYDTFSSLIKLEGAPEIPFSLSQEDLKALPQQELSIAKENLRSFALEGGISLLEESNSLKGKIFSQESLHQSENVEKVLDLIDRIEKEELPEVMKEVSAVCDFFGFKVPNQIFEANNLARTLSNTNELSLEVTPEIYELDLRSTCIDLLPSQSIERYFLWLISPSRNNKYKAAIGQVLYCVYDQSLKEQDLYAIATQAKNHIHHWATTWESPSKPAFWDRTAVLEGALAKLEQSLGALGSLLKIDSLVNYNQTPFEEISQLINELSIEKQNLMNFPRLHALFGYFQEKNLERFIRIASEEQLNSESSIAAFELVWYRKVHELLVHKNRSVSSFSRELHDNVVKTFHSADTSHVKGGAERVQRAWAVNSVNSRNKNIHESSVVTKEANLKRGHKSIRDLFGQAKTVMTSVKPCWVMSPLIVSEMLPAEKCFDIVVFDEASQIPPANAITVLLRGKQAIVAGDSKQLPPTSFFTSNMEDEEEEEEEFKVNRTEEEQEEFEKGFSKGQSVALVTGIESLLDQMSALLPAPIGEKYLSWHYRSKNERLIAFSNAHPELYDSRLTTFPGTNENDCIAYVNVPHTKRITAVAATSDDEASKVIDLILEHINETPEKSLGVITFGSPHEQKIKDKWFGILEKQDAAREFTEKHDQGEPFFIKNIERVQGDERDSIILSTGYTKTPDGRMRYQFGPITTQGGYRRLNVAITRAKERVTVVSTFSSGDMQDSELRSTGPRMLKEYLKYAESGGAELNLRKIQKPEMNPFEWDVYNSLKAKGLILEPQYGYSGRWIDFAVMHPEFPGLPILAIETDGARYHSSVTSRDSDRLRQSQLEAQGWTFHRIWSTSWFRKKEEEIELAVHAAGIARYQYDNPHAAADPKLDLPSEPDVKQNIMEASRSAFPRGIYQHMPLNSYTHHQLVSLINWIKSDGLLRTNDELVQEVAPLLGRSVIKKRLRDMIIRAAESIKN